MPSVDGICGGCGESVKVHFGQSARHWMSGLGWWESYRCEKCGDAVEADGGDDMPDDYRRIILEEEGAWEIRLSQRPELETDTLHRIKKALGLTLAEVAALKNCRGALAKGTKAEMEHKVALLSSEGVDACIWRSCAKAE